MVHKKVILELEEVRSCSENALIMGFILANLTEAIRAEYQKAKLNDEQFRHITLVEEAHRLLGKYEPGDSRSKKQGIEMFSDMLAEVRKYGESLVIVDQIPGKLTPEVLKNTNTKIVHKLFAQDDKEAIGNTMALSEEQKGFLSLLDKGRTIVFSQGWETSLQVQVIPETNTGSGEIISENDIRQAAMKYYCSQYKRNVFPSLKNWKEVPSVKTLEEHIQYKTKIEALIETYQGKFLKKYTAGEEDSKLIKELEKILSVEQQAELLRDYLYFVDEENNKLDLINSLLVDVRNGEHSLAKYNEKLSYGRRTTK